jgi:hypothetical protein
MSRALVLCLLSNVHAIDNGLALTPPLGWRSYNAFGGHVSQPLMEAMMDALVDRSRAVDGTPMSLLDLGYNHVGLDGGWNYCFPENHTFHWASDGRPVWNDDFPNPSAMVAKAHTLGLRPGWYLNNCGCAENHFDAEMTDRVMRGSVRMLAEQGWDGVKFDSCSMFHNLTRWAELINATGRPVLIENCHQGAYTPGMRQWQGYVKHGSSYTHFLGMFFGMEQAMPLPNVSFADCRAQCDALQAGCGGFCFEGIEPAPTAPIGACFLKERAQPNHMDMSNANYCDGATSPSDCPFNFYRVSGDISSSWGSMLANLQYTLPFLGEGGLHLPYPSDQTVRSRPGGWAYPDMLEVGNLANATEDRSHFGAWAIMSSPLILSFNLSDQGRMDRVWPIVSNRAIIRVNQRWAGDPGRRVASSADGWQAWAKRMGATSFAVFFIGTGAHATHPSLPPPNISAAFDPKRAVCARDLYSAQALPPFPPGAPLEATLPVHDSAFYCVWPSSAHGRCDGPGAKDCP